MRIPGRRHWALWHMERGLRWSDPHLAAMLAYMASLTPDRISHTFTGQAVKNPTIMPICMPNQ